MPAEPIRFLSFAFGVVCGPTVPLEVTVDPERRVIKMRGSGILTDADLGRAHDLIEGNPAADPMFARICDLSEVSDVEVSDNSLDAWAADPVSNPPVRHAIICNAPPIMKRVLDYMRLSRKQFREVSIFPDFDKAFEWLNRDH